MSRLQQTWEAIRSFFGFGEEQRRQEEMEDNSRRLAKEKLAALGDVIDHEIDALSFLEKKWQETYSNVEAYVKKRDERDQGFARLLRDVEEDTKTLCEQFSEESVEDLRRRREAAASLSGEMPGIVDRTDSLTAALEAHRSRIESMLSSLRGAVGSIGAISGTTLQAAMLSARFGEDAAEFAAICDRIREQSVEGLAGLREIEKELAAEIDAFEATVAELLNIKEQLGKSCETVAVFNGEEPGADRRFEEETPEICVRIRDRVSEMVLTLEEAEEVSRSIEEETKNFRAVDEDEVKCREEIESVAEEIRLMITEA